MTFRVLLLAFILPILSHAEDYDAQKTQELRNYLISLDETDSLVWSPEISIELSALVGKGADPDVKSPSNMSSVGYAIEYGDMQLVDYLLGQGTKIIAWHFAKLLDFGRDQQLIQLIKLCSERPHIMKSEGDRVLAVLFLLEWKTEYADLVRAMVKNGANINGVSHEITWYPRPGHPVTIQNPLMRASKNGNLEAIQLLIELGADPEVQDEADMKAVHHAARANQVVATTFLIARTAWLDL